LDFLPYTASVCTSLLQARTASPHTLLVSRCVNEAVEREHISLTIPWAVDYMSMIDSHALHVPQVHSLLCQMVAIYRSTLLEGGSVTADSFLVLACLGWLLETPNVSSSVFFQCLKSDGFQPSKLPQSELVTRDLLYICCPYLACIRVTLAEFASGLQSKTSPIRKIKPVPAGPDTTHTQSSPVSPLQLKLQENFFRNHPPLFKQLCDTVSERVSETAVQLVQSEIVPEHVRSGLQSLALWIGQSCSDQPGSGSCINLEELFHRSEAVRKVAQVRDQTFSCALKEATQFCRGHSEANTSRAMSALVCATIPKQVLTVAIGIAVDWCIERCMKWINSKLRGIVFEEVSGGYEKLRKAVRIGVKASQSHHSDNLQSHSNISVPSPIATNRSYQSYDLSSDISSGLPSPNANSQTNNRPVSSLDESSKHSHPSPSSGHYLEISDHSSCNILQSPTQDLSTSALPTASQALLRKPDGKGTSSQTALCPMSLFMKLTSPAMAEKHSSPQKDGVLEVVAATESVREFLLAQFSMQLCWVSHHYDVIEHTVY
ncbi:Codanin-1, partial [Geodia barretti]